MSTEPAENGSSALPALATPGGSLHTRVQWIGLIAGPVLALGAFVMLPDTFTDAEGAQAIFTPAGRATLGVMVWMATWWLTEAVEVAVTALLPIAVFPLLGIADVGASTSPYAHPLIFLFMGGFLLALSMQRWGLDRRIALITLRLVGTRPANMVGGFMIATAMLSAFVSNTATTAMMLPIALSVIVLVRRQTESNGERDGTFAKNFALCLMLGVAYAASIGGIATIIGTPPNAFLVAFIEREIDPAYQREISFVRWLLIGVPVAVVFLPLTWWLLTRVIYPVHSTPIEGGRDLIETQYRELGPTKRSEWITLVVFLVTATLWIIRPILADGIIDYIDPETKEHFYHLRPLIPGLTDTGIVMATALLLFVIPVDVPRRTFVMNWDTARKLPWGILILFGGGLSLAAAVHANGVAEFLAALTGAFKNVPDVVIILVVVTMMIFLTELTSNFATTATMVPLLAALAPALGVHPYLLIVPAAIAASGAFMMPVATPPNAIVFGSGYVTIPQMCKAGIWLNLIGMVLITLLAYTIIGRVLGVG